MRFDGHFNPTFHPERLKDKFPQKPSKIFVCSMADLFGDWIDDEIIHQVISVAGLHPEHQFYFLTKNPEKMTYFKFPDNCWVGTTIESRNKFERLWRLQEVEAKKKFISFEPLLGEIEFDFTGQGIDLVIIGANTDRSGIQTRKEWDKIKHPNKFYKNNFKSLIQ